MKEKMVFGITSPPTWHCHGFIAIGTLKEKSRRTAQAQIMKYMFYLHTMISFCRPTSIAVSSLGDFVSTLQDRSVIFVLLLHHPEH